MQAGGRAGTREGLESREHRISRELQMGHVAEHGPKAEREGEELLG